MEHSVYSLVDTEKHIKVEVFTSDYNYNPLYDLDPEFCCVELHIKDTDFNTFSKDGKYFMFPVYVMKYSGLSFALAPFNDRWDSYLAGYIYVTQSGFDSEAKAREYANEVIKDLEAYYNDDVYVISVIGRPDEDDWIVFRRNEAINKADELFTQLCKQVPEQGSLI